MAARMPFGKHKDKPINQIDRSYLEWVLANCQQISPDLRKAICKQLGLEFKNDPKDREIVDLQAQIKDLRHQILISRLEAYDEGLEAGKSQCQEKVKAWHRSLAMDYHGSTEAITALNDAYDRLRKILGF